MLRIRVLGGLALEVGGLQRSLPETARGRALLAFCALNPGPHPRGRLASALRPDVLDRSARATLRQAIWALRQAVGEAGEAAIVADRDRFGLREDAVWVDVLELRRLAAAGDIDAALDLAGGELLPELDDEWALAARDAHHDEVGELLARRAEEAAATGDLTAAVASARRAAEHDPRSERAARALMTRLAEAGDRPAALATYRSLSDRLQRELGVAPSAPTRELANAIRAASPDGAAAGATGGAAAAAPSARPPSRPPAPPPGAPLRIPLPPRLRDAPRSPFVGRDKALGRLRETWQATAAGSRRLVEVWGDAGIGKTRLARELALEAQAAGGVVLLGSADEDPISPFQPFTEALAHVVPELSDADLRAIAGSVAPDLVRLVPSLGDRLGVTAATDGDADQRLRLFEAFAAVLRGLTDRAPVLLVLDDFHWADPPTLKLLRHVLRSPRGPHRILLVLTCRTGGAAPVQVEREISVERIRLGGLEEDEASALLGAAAGELGDDRCEEIVRRTEGNPFFLELFRDGDAERIPAGVRDAIEQRISALPGRVQEAVVLAAVAGPTFDLSILEATLRDDVLEAVDAAVGAGVVEEDAEVFGRYRFRHALLREVLYEQPSRVRRSRMHLALAQALEREGGREAEVAHHLLTALPDGDALRAVTAAARAARRAGFFLAHEESVALYRRALAAEPEGGLSDRDRAEMLIGLGEAETRSGARDRARPALEEAAALAARLGDGPLLARAALAHGGVGVVITAADPVTVRLLRDALALLPDDDPLRVRALARLSVELYYADKEEAQTLSANAVTLARHQREPAALAAALNARHVALWTPNHTEERLAVAAEMEEMALRAGDREQSLQAHNWLVLDLLELGEILAVDAAIEAYEREAEAVGLPSYEWYVPLWRSMRATMEGRWAAAEELMHEARELGRRAQDDNADLFWIIQNGHLLCEQSRYDELDLPGIERQAAERVETAWSSWRAFMFVVRGEPEAARRLIEPLAAGGWAGLPIDANWHVMTEAAEVVVALGEREWAASLYERMLPYAELQAVIARAIGTYGPTAYFLGKLAATIGRWEDADAHLSAAIAANEAIGAAPRLARAQEARGLVMRERGLADRGEALLAEALAAYERLSMSQRAASLAARI